ncbi:DUF6894 family protein [Microvirga massiliensis]|uniref:DUF6894 family protein n=1 Tax=Microvirga massiliensis TaxID=1033741 RepID=UPI00062BD518|nr:hypothetical protein [Microvirga massiliensis]
MKRYYFHLVDGHEIIPDKTGLDVTDLEQVRAEVIEAIREFRQEQSAAAAEWKDWRIEVTDAWGGIAMSLGLSDAEVSGFARAGH